MNPVNKPIKRVVVPLYPKIDEMAAAAVAMVMEGQRYSVEVCFCRTVEPTDGMMKYWSEHGTPVLIDVGTEKYHGQARSTFELVLRRYPELAKNPVARRMAGVLNANNGLVEGVRGGYLKAQPHSVARMLRWAANFEPELDSDELFDRATKVVRAYFKPRRRDWVTPSEAENSKLFQLWSELGNPHAGNLGDFTLQRYFYELYTAGVCEQEIFEEINYWLDLEMKIEDAKSLARLKHYAPTITNQGGLAILTIEVENYFQAAAFLRKWVDRQTNTIAVLKTSSTGKVVIIGGGPCKKLDCKKLFNLLSEKEPGLWYNELRFRKLLLMNGNQQLTGLPATKLKLPYLAGLVISCIN